MKMNDGSKDATAYVSGDSEKKNEEFSFD